MIRGLRMIEDDLIDCSMIKDDSMIRQPFLEDRCGYQKRLIIVLLCRSGPDSRGTTEMKAYRVSRYSGSQALYVSDASAIDIASVMRYMTAVQTLCPCPTKGKHQKTSTKTFNNGSERNQRKSISTVSNPHPFAARHLLAFA